MLNQRFSRLVVVSEAPDYVSPGGKHIRKFKCLCDCGETTVSIASDLKRGRMQSCGCLKREQIAAKNFKHGMTSEMKGDTYMSWKSMRTRCNNPNATKYKDYGAVGIKVDQDWDDYSNFVRDMGLRPPGMSIDRIDNSKGYSKANCRWATTAQQQANKKPKSNPNSKPVASSPASA